MVRRRGPLGQRKRTPLAERVNAQRVLAELLLDTGTALDPRPLHSLPFSPSAHGCSVLLFLRRPEVAVLLRTEFPCQAEGRARQWSHGPRPQFSFPIPCR